jgi:general secretion pathway protein A
VLQLKSPQGDKRQILLKSLMGETATLEVAGQPLEIPLPQLQSWWTGDYLMFWRPQTSLAFIGPGSSGEPVIWLRRRLALAEGQEPPAEQDISAVFDLALAERVRNFQRAHDLQADGVVGQRTMALLDNLAPAPGTPVLTAPALTKVN